MMAPSPMATPLRMVQNDAEPDIGSYQDLRAAFRLMLHECAELDSVIVIDEAGSAGDEAA